MTGNFSNEQDRLRVELRLRRKAQGMNQLEISELLNERYGDNHPGEKTPAFVATQSRVSKFESGKEAYLLQHMRREVEGLVEDFRKERDTHIPEQRIDREVAEIQEARVSLERNSSLEERRRSPLIDVLVGLMATPRTEDEVRIGLSKMNMAALLDLYALYSGEDVSESGMESRTN